MQQLQPCCNPVAIAASSACRIMSSGCAAARGGNAGLSCARNGVCDPCDEQKAARRSMLELGIAEQRLVLTSDKQVLLQRDCAHVYLVAAPKKKDQLTEVIREFGITLDASKIMSRCTYCGGDFLDRPLAFAELPPECSVPEGVHENYNSFYVCSCCKKVFWQGGQYDHALQQLTKRCQGLGGQGAAAAHQRWRRRVTLLASDHES
jgi:uncharacterized protein with PIN domain